MLDALFLSTYTLNLLFVLIKCAMPLIFRPKLKNSQSNQQRMTRLELKLSRAYIVFLLNDEPFLIPKLGRAREILTTMLHNILQISHFGSYG